MDEIYVPVLHYFENGNPFAGSAGSLRFLLTVEQQQIRAQLWYGLLCYEKSEVRHEASFPLTPQGREALAAFLQQHRNEA